MKSEHAETAITISFENITLPPFRDILVLTKKCPHGLNGTAKCMNMLAPDDFELLEISHDIVEAALINRQLLKRLDKECVLELLMKYVFPEMSPGDFMKVDIDVRKTVRTRTLHEMFP